MSFHSELSANQIYPSQEHKEKGEEYLKRDWNENVLHVYPYTFNEVRSEGEAHRGIGSIRGITEKLDWMADSGVTAIWLGPIYESPGLDGNYDVANYRKVNSELGTLEDVKELIARAHESDIRVIFDLVPNHTSDQSEWFQASRDPNHPLHEKYKDYYIWKDPIPGKLPKNIVGEDRLKGMPDGMTVPNNWTSIFSVPQIDKVRIQNGGEIPEGTDIPAVSAWAWDNVRQQLYLAEFMKQQPTLDWRNPTVRAEIKDVMRFWLDLGVDSFRVDVMNHIGKDPEFQDEDPAPVGKEIGQYNPGVTNPHDQWKQERLVSHWPELGEYTEELLAVLDESQYTEEERRLVLEDWMSALNHDARLDNIRPDKANVFNFEMLLNSNRKNWRAHNIRQLILQYYARISLLRNAMPNQVTGNHDTDTLRTRLGSPAASRSAHLLLASLPGALYTWQGDMLGRPNVIVPEPLQKDGDIGKRDGERVPMQWNDTTNGGFSEAKPYQLWLPSVDMNVYANDNLTIQARDPRSPYRLVRAALLRRKKDAALRYGGMRMLQTDHANVLGFARASDAEPRRQVVSLTNFSAETIPVYVHGTEQSLGKITLSSIEGRENGSRQVELSREVLLRPDESVLIDSLQ